MLELADREVLDACRNWQTSRQVAARVGVDVRGISPRLNGLVRRGLLEKRQSRVGHVKWDARKLIQYRTI